MKHSVILLKYLLTSSQADGQSDDLCIIHLLLCAFVNGARSLWFSCWAANWEKHSFQSSEPLLKLTMKSHQAHTKPISVKLETKIECHLNLGGSLWIPELSSLAWTWSIALLLPKLHLIYGLIIYNAVLHDSLLLPDSVSDSKTDYMLD